MAGDWIKIEENMTDKPEVAQMAAILGIESDAVAGKLIRVWSWASRNCNADGVTNVTVRALLDRHSGVTNFTGAMIEVGWLLVDGDKMMFPKFERHCSETAKERVLRNRRVAKHRQIGNANVTVGALQNRIPEKRRDNTPIVPLKGTLQLRAEKIFGRRPETPLTKAELRAFKNSKDAIQATTEEQWQALEAFYAAPQHLTYARKDLATLVNNWNGEIDRALAYQSGSKTTANHQPAVTRV